MIRLSLLAIILSMTACLPPEAVRIVQVKGDVVSAATGPVEIWFLHTHWGEGMLKTQNMVIETQWFDGPGAIDEELAIPQTHGEGLSLYGWQDVNGDGDHCRPGSEISGCGDSERTVSFEVSPSTRPNLYEALILRGRTSMIRILFFCCTAGVVLFVMMTARRWH